MKTISNFLLLLLCNYALIAQSRKIVGIVYERTSGSTVKPVVRGASVFIPGIGSATTDDKGYYSIDLTQCPACRPGEAVKIYVNSAVGYTECDYTIPNNPGLHPFEIVVSQNSKLSLNGIVRSKKGGRFLKGIKVTVLIQNQENMTPAVFTDENGRFQIVIRKEGITGMQAIQIMFSDERKGRYRDLEEAVFINKYEPIKVEMEECDDCGSRTTLNINTYTKSSIEVHKGDMISLRAEGIIKVGELVGTSGPGGIPGNKGVGGFSLAPFNLFPNWNHAVLVYRFGPADSWKYYQENGSNTSIAQTNGFIEFNVNDRKQEDNSGSYKVTIIVKD